MILNLYAGHRTCLFAYIHELDALYRVFSLDSVIVRALIAIMPQHGCFFTLVRNLLAEHHVLFRLA